MDLTLPEDVVKEVENDVLGGKVLLESGVYTGVIKQAYLDSSKSGAKRITLHFEHEGSIIKATEYITNRIGEMFYVDKRDGSKKPLPGYSKMNSFFLAATKRKIDQQTAEKQFIKLYDYDSGKDINTEVEVFLDVINKEIKIGVLRVSEEKTTVESNWTKGTGEFRTYNEFSKFFNSPEGLTNSELDKGLTSGEFIHKWDAQNAMKTRIKKAKIPGEIDTGISLSVDSANTPNLFP